MEWTAEQGIPRLRSSWTRWGSWIAVGLLVCRAAAAQEPVSEDPRDQFFEHLRSVCGSRYEGTSSFPADPEDAFFGKPLVAVVAECDGVTVRIPFAVGSDHSRTWVISRSADGLRLRHDHRHEDGTPDEITLYGGWATEEGTATAQSFAADAYTKELIPAAATNVWTISFDAEGRLTYYLERHGKPRFRATLEPAAAR